MIPYQPESKADQPVVWCAPVAECAALDPVVVVPVPASSYFASHHAGSLNLRVVYWTPLIILQLIPVLNPLRHISGHIVKAQLIWGETSDRPNGSFILFSIRVNYMLSIACVVCSAIFDFLAA